MGSPESEEGRDSDESPQHRVTISYQFAVGKFEVTFGEWDACVREVGCSHRPNDWDEGGGLPVIYVSWEDAKEYVNWLSRKTGKQYRLLSESEWEYVARAGTTGPLHFGSTISTDQAIAYIAYGKRMPVGSFPSNEFGLHDVHGNVWEWVEDCWHDSYAGAPADGSAWVSGNCGGRVLRGGSWNWGPKYLRSASRDWYPASGRNFAGSGFRVARTLIP